ncbi:MAG: hypothetical protein B1H11_04335 [Desulfobacteraceae bacterium 4484_190.1]|nr:MAG: hypothetical protein B1H11_04335 [Desulfobacteraceae bacterium 4484_190.1]
MTAPELREIAKKISGVEGTHGMKKEELLSIIKKDRGIKDTKAPRKKKGSKNKPQRNIKELKGKIIHLKKEKRHAREAKESHKIDILRRRINRLKKQTRKIAHG